MAPEHHPYYCEENIYRLLASGRLGPGARALWVTNATRTVACWAQRVAPSLGHAVVWDYHVVGVTAGPDPRVWDLDSVLEMPCPLERWLGATFAQGAPPSLEPAFRVIDGERYVAELRTDRAHMRTAEGAWQEPPPPWPAPGAGRGSNLDTWMDLSVGEWLDRVGVAERLVAP